MSTKIELLKQKHKNELNKLKLKHNNQLLKLKNKQKKELKSLKKNAINYKYYNINFSIHYLFSIIKIKILYFISKKK